MLRADAQRQGGVGLVVPTLLTWPTSAIVHDIKGENWEITAGLRARIGRVLLFDPANANSAAYNPLLEVRRGIWEVRESRTSPTCWSTPKGSLERPNHWEKTSHSLLVGTILRLLYAGPDKTLAAVANFLSDPRRPIDTTLKVMMTTAHLGSAGIRSVQKSPVLSRPAFGREGNGATTIRQRNYEACRALRRLEGAATPRAERASAALGSNPYTA